MSEYTVKKIDEMEAIFLGGYKRARAELEASAFGPTTPTTTTPRKTRRRSSW
jgi:hypothetical protein